MVQATAVPRRATARLAAARRTDNGERRAALVDDRSHRAAPDRRPIGLERRTLAWGEPARGGDGITAAPLMKKADAVVGPGARPLLPRDSQA